MNRHRLLSVAVGAALTLGALPAMAGKDIDTGRLTLKFQEANWQGSAEMPYQLELKSAQGTFGGKAKVLSLAGADGAPLAVMYVGVTYGKTNVYSRRGNCFEEARFYVRDLNDSKLENYRCVYAGGPFESDGLMGGGLLSYLKDSFDKVTVAAPDDAYFTMLHVTARGGYVLHIEALMAPAFVGLPTGKPVGDVPAQLSPAVAAWADRLAENALKALTSFSGNLEVPPVEFLSAAK
jgi:hypothetical protein